MEKSIYTIFFKRCPALGNLLITRNVIHRDIVGGISAAKVVNRLVVRSTGLWQKCYYRSPQQVRRVSGGWRCGAQASVVGGWVAGGFHEGARRHQSESWHPSTRQPPRHRDTGTTTHLSALLPLPPRILFRFHCPECVTSRQAGSSVVARPPKSTEQWCRAPELVNHYLSLTQRPVKTARIITVC